MPRINDAELEYVESHFLAIHNAYLGENIQFTDEQDKASTALLNEQEFRHLFIRLCAKFDLKINLNFVDEIDELFDGIPIIYECTHAIDATREIQVDLTPFARENWDITLVELILFLMDVKVRSDGYIQFEDDFYEDYENHYRPFMVMLAIYFGLGELLIKRYWISGEYQYKIKTSQLNFKYFVPLDINSILYAHGLNIMQNKYDLNTCLASLKNLNQDYVQELKAVVQYIRDGHSPCMSPEGEVLDGLWDFETEE